MTKRNKIIGAIVTGVVLIGAYFGLKRDNKKYIETEKDPAPEGEPFEDDDFEEA